MDTDSTDLADLDYVQSEFRPRDAARKRQVAMMIPIATFAVVGAIGLATRLHLFPSSSDAVIACIDPSSSTAQVRPSYLPDLLKVVRQAATRRQDFYADDCGNNATGTVDWAVRRRFGSSRWNPQMPVPLLLEAEKVRPPLERLIEGHSEGEGMPLGEVLSVIARQCGQAGGGCTVYVFTNGEWADQALKARDGISDRERSGYLRAYIPQLEDLKGSQVNFVGVGYGTTMGAVRLSEAREIARELVEDTGGEMGAWTTRF